MIEYNDLGKNIKISKPILTIGTFDGVHIGHQQILKQLNEIAFEVGGSSVLFTFYPHPRSVLLPTNPIELLQNQDEKIEKLKSYGLNCLIRVPFTPEFASLSSDDFVQKILVKKINVHTVVVGYDHQFGKDRKGTIEGLKKMAMKFDFNVVEIPAQTIDSINVSSSKIRKAIKKGEVKVANEFLGNPFVLSGKVVEGLRVGRSIGFPTANIEIDDENKILPKNGSYFVRVRVVEEFYFGMLNIGFRPTVESSNLLSVEVHIFDFDKMIYGECVCVEFLDKIRLEQHFHSVERLKNQLIQDEEYCRNLFTDFIE